ncbi:hypothetical protein V6Z12_A03G015700 [Gossypium hirsutum]
MTTTPDAERLFGPSNTPSKLILTNSRVSPYGPECTTENPTLTRGELVKNPGHSRNRWSIVSDRSPQRGQLELFASFLHCIFTFVGK